MRQSMPDQNRPMPTNFNPSRREESGAKLRYDIPIEVSNAFAQASKYFASPLQQFQFFDKYSRFDAGLGRRETWAETVDRAVDFLHWLSSGRLTPETYSRIRNGIIEMKVMPSMRLLAMAGKAARRNNVTIYNCAYIPVDSLDAFVEAMLICLNGCGVGFSVESEYITQLPYIQHQRQGKVRAFTVADSTEGWADALRIGLNTWFAGDDIRFDFSGVRPAGAPLLTKGGTASGSAPLERMLRLIRSRILNRQGTVLSSLDAHDVMCAIAGVPIAGGVRPGVAMISIFDVEDAEMRLSKSGAFEVDNKQRWNANNSVVWRDGNVTKETLTSHMRDMIESRRGEPGIFNRFAAIQNRPERRSPEIFGTNPCGEIVLRPWQFCNLSSAIARPDDSVASLREKVELAATIGTIQSLATYFPGLRPQWKINCEEERLLGVDISGHMDCPTIRRPHIQEYLRKRALAVSELLAAQLKIRRSAAVTCVKPSGNSSQLVNCSSGIHPRWAQYYIRNVRIAAYSPIFQLLRDSGAPMDPENGQTEADANTWVVHFPVKSPDNAIVRNDRSAIAQCEYWLQTARTWAEHNASCTVTYRPEEVDNLVEWVWQHRHTLQGLTFLPSEDLSYSQPPYVEISKSAYEDAVRRFPLIDYSGLYQYENTDSTSIAQDVACSAPSCEA